MNFWMFVALSGSVLLPASAAFFRLDKREGDYLPFFLLLWTGSVNEVLKLVLLLLGERHAVTSNVFSLVRAVLLVWQFRNWHLYGSRRELYLPTQAGFGAAWLVSVVLFPRPQGFNTLFNFYSSLVLALMALSLLSRQIIRNQGPVLKDPVFLVCCGLILYFSFASLTEALWWAGLYQSVVFQYRVSIIFSFVNLFTNLLFFVAILWIPRKASFLLRYS